MDDIVSTHLGSTPKSWGDGRRQADVGDTEDQRGTGGKVTVIAVRGWWWSLADL